MASGHSSPMPKNLSQFFILINKRKSGQVCLKVSPAFNSKVDIMLDNMYVVVVLLTIAATITFMILLYLLMMCIAALRGKDRLPPPRPRSSAMVNQMNHGINSQARRMVPTRRAPDNTYLSSPQARLPETHSRPSSTLPIPSRIVLRSSDNSVGGHELEVMRFYTAEELLHFPFEEHQRQLNELIEAEERNAQFEVDRRRRSSHSHHHHHSVYVPSTNPDMVHITTHTPESLRAREDRDRRCMSVPTASSIYQMAPESTPARMARIEEEPPTYDEALRLHGSKTDIIP